MDNNISQALVEYNNTMFNTTVSLKEKTTKNEKDSQTAIPTKGSNYD